MKTIFFCCSLLSSPVTVTELVTSLISLEDVVQMRSGSVSYRGAKELFFSCSWDPACGNAGFILIPLQEERGGDLLYWDNTMSVEK